MVNLESTKRELFDLGVERAKVFLLLNGLSLPTFITYQDVFTGSVPTSLEYRILRKLERGPRQGYATGYYSHGTVFVNLDKAAKLVKHPRITNWSFPGYKIDREPCGVVAHETGHHVDNEFFLRFMRHPSDTPAWLSALAHSSRITGYEPRPSESFAETLRLFILNPDLLAHGSERRYRFLTESLRLKASESRDFRSVLDHPEYITAAENWIAKSKAVK